MESNFCNNDNGKKQGTKRKRSQPKKEHQRPIVSLDGMIESGRATVVDDVKTLMQAIENGMPHNELHAEIKRLYHVIVDGCMQDVVAEGCGKRSLLKVLRWGRKLVVGNKNKTNDESKNIPQSPGAIKDRDIWLRWFAKTYGVSGERPMSEEWYKVIRTAALKVDFTELKKKSKSKAVFYLNGFSECCRVANIGNYYETTPKKRFQGQRASHSQITRKEWGSAYKPARG